MESRSFYKCPFTILKMWDNFTYLGRITIASNYTSLEIKIELLSIDSILFFGEIFGVLIYLGILKCYSIN